MAGQFSSMERERGMHGRRLWPILRGNSYMFMKRVGEKRRSSFRPEIRILNLPYFEAAVRVIRHDVLALVFVGTCLTKRVYDSPGRHPAVVEFPDCL
jgi:hypothetical protein